MKLQSAILLGLSGPSVVLAQYRYTLSTQFGCQSGNYRSVVWNTGPSCSTDCISTDPGAAAVQLEFVGAKGGANYPTCSMYTSGDCTGQQQSIGQRGNGPSCTNSNIGWIRSMRCYAGCSH